MQPRSFAGQLRMTSMELRTFSINSSTSLGQLLARSRLARDRHPRRVQLRSVRRKMLDAQAAMPAEKLFEGRSSVGGRIVEQSDNRAAQMAQQLAQENTDFVLPDVAVKEQIVQSQTMPPWTDGNSRDNRNLVPPPLTVTMDGSLSLRSPCSYYVGNQQEADSSAKDDVGAQRAAFFLCAASPLVSNVRSRLHRAPAHAAPVFCGVHPMPCIRRPIWSGW